MTRKNLKILIISIIFLLVIVGPGNARINENKDVTKNSFDTSFTLPEWGGGMVHSDPHQSDNIKLPVPTEDVDIIWRCNDKLSEKSGVKTCGFVGNGEIAACCFTNCFSVINPDNLDNLIIYDYEGNRLWESDNLINCLATFSTPMVDIHNRVIACDNKVILMVDLYDYDDDNNSANSDKELDWINYFVDDLNDLISEESISLIDAIGVPFSPTITDNGIIVVPMFGGPILSFNSTDGTLLDYEFLGLNEIEIDDYYETPIMSINDYELIFLNQTISETEYEIYEQNTNNVDYEIICYQTENSPLNLINDNTIVWNSSISFGALPFDTVVIQDNSTIFKIPKDQLMVYAYDAETGELLACTELAEPKAASGFIDMWYSGYNCPCANGSRIYLLVEYRERGLVLVKDPEYFSARLYAIDVDSNGELNIAWYYELDTEGQSTPLFIDDVLYFTGYPQGAISEESKNFVYAIRDNRSYASPVRKWKTEDGKVGCVEYDNVTLFSLAEDPRGGFWYIDSQVSYDIKQGRKLVRFDTLDGSIIEEIVVDDLMPDNNEYIPMSVPQICSSGDDLTMIVSANYHDPDSFFDVENYVIAIDLEENDNTLMWKVLIEENIWWRHASGQYTILLDDNNENPRIVFCKWAGGVYALGTDESDLINPSPGCSGGKLSSSVSSAN